MEEVRGKMEEFYDGRSKREDGRCVARWKMCIRCMMFDV